MRDIDEISSLALEVTPGAEDTPGCEDVPEMPSPDGCFRTSSSGGMRETHKDDKTDIDRYSLARPTYRGQYRSGQRNGLGVYRCGEEEYRGDWVSGKKHGHGVMQYRDGHVYSGSFARGGRSGYGAPCLYCLFTRYLLFTPLSLFMIHTTFPVRVSCFFLVLVLALVVWVS